MSRVEKHVDLLKKLTLEHLKNGQADNDEHEEALVSALVDLTLEKRKLEKRPVRAAKSTIRVYQNGVKWAVIHALGNKSPSASKAADRMWTGIIDVPEGFVDMTPEQRRVAEAEAALKLAKDFLTRYPHENDAPTSAPLN